eukprot:768693-Hanusia_phi.AAC.12
MSSRRPHSLPPHNRAACRSDLVEALSVYLSASVCVSVRPRDVTISLDPDSSCIHSSLRSLVLPSSPYPGGGGLDR